MMCLFAIVKHGASPPATPTSPFFNRQALVNRYLNIVFLLGTITGWTKKDSFSKEDSVLPPRFQNSLIVRRDLFYQSFDTRHQALRFK
jgi:hypothetical protein